VHVRGACSCSGYLPCPSQIKAHPAALATPIRMFHGEDDPLVLVDWARASQSQITTMGFTNVTLRTYEDLVHSASIEELRDVLAWMQAVLPDKAPTSEL
jgi:predicted esterase